MAHFKPTLLLCLAFFAATSLHSQQQTERADTTMMREVSINGQRQRISYRLDRQKIDASQVLTAQGGTAFDVLRAVPGVVVDADGSLSYRGSQEFLVYVDGKPSPLSGTEALQMIGASSIRDIEILTTPSAKYKTEGDVGIINIAEQDTIIYMWADKAPTSTTKASSSKRRPPRPKARR